MIGLGAVAAGLALALPPRGSLDDESALSTTRVETEDGPVASASLLARPGQLEVGGELTDVGELGQAGPPPIRLGDAVGGISLDATRLSTVIEPTDPPSATTVPAAPTTTAWVEPELPPESEWVDTGNGVRVPDLLLRIRFCESTNNYQAANSSSSARGAYQFLTMSWEWYGHAERFGVAQAHLATPAQQDQAALATLQAEGTGPWAESRPCWNDPDLDPRYATAVPPTTATRPSTTTTTVGSTTTGSSTTASSTTDSTASTTATTAPTSSTAPSTTAEPTTTSASSTASS